MDDTDSKNGMCTTYVGAVARDRLLEKGYREADYPSLVRLNPNCPFKTRGNAAVALHLRCGREKVDDVFRTVVEVVEELYERGERNTQPGVVALLHEQITEELHMFAERVVRDIVGIEEAVGLAEKLGARVYGVNGGRGIIGALASVGYRFDSYTFEAIAYRLRENWGTVRRIDTSSVYEMDRRTRGRTFDNIDYETGEVRIAPHTPCPVLAGVRATSPESALEALGMVRFLEPIERVVVYKTNQATDKHLIRARIGEVKPFMSVIVEGRVVENPYTIPGGHVFFRISDGEGLITCAVYEPTQSLRNVARKLVRGDLVRVMGGVKPKPQGLTLNVEKLEVLELAEHVVCKPPKCPVCGGRMKSKGRKAGYKCNRCGVRKPYGEAEKIVLERDLKPGVYEAPPSARRHLSRPLKLMFPPAPRREGG